MRCQFSPKHARQDSSPQPMSADRACAQPWRRLQAGTDGRQIHRRSTTGNALFMRRQQRSTVNQTEYRGAVTWRERERERKFGARSRREQICFLPKKSIGVAAYRSTRRRGVLDAVYQVFVLINKIRLNNYGKNLIVNARDSNNTHQLCPPTLK